MIVESQPLVSVAIPCYNHEKYIEQAIRSVIEQSYSNIELIIIDDGSTDNSVSVIESILPDCHVRFHRVEFRYRPNKGLCRTLNEALEWCKGEYFAPVASDDILKINKTSIQVNYLKRNSSCIGAFGGIDILDEKNRTTTTVLKKSKKYTFNDIYLHKHNLPASTQFLRTKAVRDIGGYRDDLAIEDWSMWLFLTKNGGTLDYLDTVFASYRKHEKNMSSQLKAIHEGRREVLKLFADNPLYNKSLSRIYMIAAHESQSTDRKSSYNYIKKSMQLDRSIAFNILFLKVIQGFLTSKVKNYA